jgi:hypothetical protein
MQRPTKLQFVLNLKAAKAIGVEFPAKLLALADEVRIVKLFAAAMSPLPAQSD